VTAVFVPVWALVVAGVLLLVVLPWALCAAAGRNLLPFPDLGSRIFAATSPAAADAIVAIMERHGGRQRFWGITPGVRRAILWDGTLVTSPAPWVTAKLDGRAGGIGLVARDPRAAAEAAAGYLRDRGFTARIVTDAEPEIPIVFVVTDALQGTVLNFRTPAWRFPRPQPLGVERRAG
jgi:hypothetical protein